jgi:hypothetical protein
MESMRETVVKLADTHDTVCVDSYYLVLDRVAQEWWIEHRVEQVDMGPFDLSETMRHRFDSAQPHVPAAVWDRAIAERARLARTADSLDRDAGSVDRSA